MYKDMFPTFKLMVYSNRKTIRILLWDPMPTVENLTTCIGHRRRTALKNNKITMVTCGHICNVSFRRGAKTGDG
jgi:hypothetical protein